MTFGLTLEGFNRKRLEDIKADLETGVKSTLGNDQNVEPDSVWGQLIGVFSRPLALLWELAEAVYLSEYPDSANGVALDNVAAIVGLGRQGATFSAVPVTLAGTIGIVVPAGSVASVLETGEKFETIAPATILEGPQLSVVDILLADVGTTYRITVNATDYDHTAIGGESANDIATALEVAINLGPDPVTATAVGSTVSVVADLVGSPFTIAVDAFIPQRNRVRLLSTIASFSYQVTVNATPIVYVSDSSPTSSEIIAGLTSAIDLSGEPVDATDNGDGSLTIKSTTPGGIFTISVVPQLDDTDTTPGVASVIDENDATVNTVDTIMIAQVAGAIEAPADTLTQIETPLVGWDSVTNPLDAILGRDEETDAELRLRRAESLQNAGAAVPEAIRSRVRELPGVTAAFIVENPYDAPDVDGRPGHSFEVIVQGGDDQEIGELIWQIKAAGIQTISTATGPEKIVVNVIDSQGDPHVIEFSRPTAIAIWLEVDVTLNPEETPPIDVPTAVEDDVLAFGAALNIGEDVITSKLYGVVHETPGISTIVLRIGTAPAPTLANNIPISANELATFDSSRVTVTVLP